MSAKMNPRIDVDELKAAIPMHEVAAKLGLWLTVYGENDMDCPVCRHGATIRDDQTGYRCRNETGKCGHSGDALAAITKVERVAFTGAMRKLGDMVREYESETGASAPNQGSLL